MGRKRTLEQGAAQRRSADNRKCPQCGRGSAMKFISDVWQFGSYCRWCGFERITQRIESSDQEAS